MIEVRYQRGLYLPEIDLWLDPQGAKPRAFVSHAHADHFARHESILCSETTSILLHKRFKIPQNRLESSVFQVPLVRDGFRLRLLPAGHIPGSSMLHVTRLLDNATLLYTGDFKVRRSRTAEAVNFLTADTLVMETTFGLPGYEFPNQLAVEADVLRFVQDGFDDGETPVLLAYSLGKAQEVLALLHEHEIPVLTHPTVALMTRACMEAGVEGLPEPIEFEGYAVPGHVVIAPPHAIATGVLKGLKSKRTAMLSGWALEPGARFRYRVETMIPFSDHADYPGLMECIQRVRPRRVLTVHGFDKEFAADLRSRQMDAWSAGGGDQLELPIQRPSPRKSAPRGPWHKRVNCAFADFSDVCRLIGETGSRIAKIRFLTGYFSRLEDDGDLKCAGNWFADVLTLDADLSPNLSLDISTLRHAVLSLPGAREERFREIQQTNKDMVRAMRLLLQELHLQPEAVNLTSISAFIESFFHESGSMDRIQRLASRLSSLHPSEGETLVRLLKKDFEIRLDVPMILEALSDAFHCEIAEIQNANRITKNLGETSVLARRRSLDKACAPVLNPNIPAILNPSSFHPVHYSSDLPFAPNPLDDRPNQL